MKLQEIPAMCYPSRSFNERTGTTLSRSYVHDVPGTDSHHALRCFYYPAKLRPNSADRMRSFYVYPNIVMHNTALLLMGRLQ